MTEKYIETERGCVHYWYESGSNPNAKRLIFLHGLTADYTLFDRQFAFFNQKYSSKGCAEYSLLTWDAPAHGKSRHENRLSGLNPRRGGKDLTGKIIQYCNAWHQETGYPLRFIPNAAHNSNIDHPEAVNSLIEDFVNRLS